MNICFTVDLKNHPTENKEPTKDKPQIEIIISGDELQQENVTETTPTPSESMDNGQSTANKNEEIYY